MMKTYFFCSFCIPKKFYSFAFLRFFLLFIVLFTFFFIFLGKWKYFLAKISFLLFICYVMMKKTSICEAQ